MHAATMIVACVESTRGPPCVELRFDFRTDRDVEAREPDLRADEVDVQRVGQRVDEAADEEERRELGEEGRRELLLDGDDEAADGEDRGFPRVILRRLDALDPWERVVTIFDLCWLEREREST